MSKIQYILPDGTVNQPTQSGSVPGVGSFPRNWLDKQDDATLTKWGITRVVAPDRVPTKPTFVETKQIAKDSLERIALTALVKDTVLQAEKAIDAAPNKAAVQVVLDSLLTPIP